eukprot:TRINITY_DN9528_c0_g1_i1.p3 TRINITY_DN9528_c0_g1~~TRINITY_DN9528_c0_g1_i1.p3  ORF type:complete len:57 (+),score=9.02 TRINITY_DN9528_c0_g1_i1:286-456(+)
MSPLSRDISGIILPVDAYGSHLDSNSKNSRASEFKLLALFSTQSDRNLKRLDTPTT